MKDVYFLLACGEIDIIIIKLVLSLFSMDVPLFGVQVQPSFTPLRTETVRENNKQKWDAWRDHVLR